MTYLLLNLVFIAIALLLLRIKPRFPSRPWWYTLLVLLILTAVFDSIIVGLDIVSYDTSKTLGILLGNAPVEDFFYAVLACIIVPALWTGLATSAWRKKK